MKLFFPLNTDELQTNQSTNKSDVHDAATSSNLVLNGKKYTK